MQNYPEVSDMKLFHNYTTWNSHLVWYWVTGAETVHEYINKSDRKLISHNTAHAKSAIFSLIPVFQMWEFLFFTWQQTEYFGNMLSLFENQTIQLNYRLKTFYKNVTAEVVFKLIYSRTGQYGGKLGNTAKTVIGL